MTRPDVIPIPLRADVTAHVHIPLDLTQAEARKIGAVVMAYAALAAGTQRAETNEDLAQSEGCQSGDAKQRNAQGPSHD